MCRTSKPQHPFAHMLHLLAMNSLRPGAILALAIQSRVTWGDAEDGGDSSDVEGQLMKVHTHASGGALAAQLGERFVVICRDSSCLGSTCNLQFAHLLQCLAIDPWRRGAMQTVIAATSRDS